MRNVGVLVDTRLWAAIGLLMLCLATAPMSTAQSSAPHPDAHAHAFDVQPYGHLAVGPDHAHIDAGASSCGRDNLADAAALRVRTTLLVLGVLVGLAVLWEIPREREGGLGRAPPRNLAFLFGGSDLLTRLCVARC